ncbi:DUF4160 domain-containing protein [Geothrix terrae]|uniref:DUF4160 domain-containing protein n=1 Tax=Geothrix terrae TaxID=2922720 RepID=UPI003B849256
MVLEILLSGGYGVGEGNQVYSIRQLVDSVNGLRIEIFSREHAPPHFHVSKGNTNATFSITDGHHLNGEIGSREKALVQWWFARSQAKLLRIWNETRPSGCQVGPIHISGA